MDTKPSIQNIGHPIVYKANLPANAQVALPAAPDMVAVRAEIRTLEGMQKEAIVHYGDTVWRMVSDEGPYLNGTDLAPFPLAFYTAGMAFSFMTELLRHAKAEEVEIRSIRTIQDNYYTMEGSALRGDMIGGAKPVEISVEMDTDAPELLISKIVERAAATSPAQAYMRDPLTNTFALCLNGKQLAVKRVAASPGGLYDDPAPKFDQISPQPDGSYAADIVTKLESAEQVFGVEGGAGSSLQSEQKRTLHVRGITTLREDGLKEARVQLFKPIGSTFCFLSDDAAEDGGLERAPAPLAYLTAGVGFCYMTQLGRYAHIMKQDLESYRIVQENIYRLAQSYAANDPVDTHVYINFSESDEAAQQLVNMGERTCFLHAAMRASIPSVIHMSG